MPPDLPDHDCFNDPDLDRATKLAVVSIGCILVAAFIAAGAVVWRAL